VIAIEFVGDGRAVVRGWGSLLSSDGILRAAREGLREGGEKARTQVRRAVQDQANLASYRLVVQAINGVPIEAGLAYKLWSNARGVRIADVRGTSMPGPVVSSPWNVGRVFKRSFVNPRTGQPVARTSNARYPLRTIYGPSPAKEMMTGRAIAVWRAAVAIDVPRAITRRMARLID
jgi:hypothetical protein